MIDRITTSNFGVPRLWAMPHARLDIGLSPTRTCQLRFKTINRRQRGSYSIEQGHLQHLSNCDRREQEDSAAFHFPAHLVYSGGCSAIITPNNERVIRRDNYTEYPRDSYTANLALQIEIVFANGFGNVFEPHRLEAAAARHTYSTLGPGNYQFEYRSGLNALYGSINTRQWLTFRTEADTTLATSGIPIWRQCWHCFTPISSNFFLAIRWGMESCKTSAVREKELLAHAYPAFQAIRDSLKIDFRETAKVATNPTPASGVGEGYSCEDLWNRKEPLQLSRGFQALFDWPEKRPNSLFGNGYIYFNDELLAQAQNITKGFGDLPEEILDIDSNDLFEVPTLEKSSDPLSAKFAREQANLTKAMRRSLQRQKNYAEKALA